MDEQLTFVHLLWVEVTRAREQQLLRALRAAPGFTDVELTEWDPTQTWFRATLPAQEHILEAAIAALLSIEGFSVEIQGAMHGPIHAIVFNAVPGQTTRPRRIWRQYDRRLPRERVSVPVSMAWAIPIPSRQAAPVAPAPQPDVAVTAGVPVARPEPVVRAGVPVARTEAAVPAGVPLARTEVVSRDRLGRVAERPGGSVAERAVTAGLAGWRPRLAVAELFRSGVKDERVSRLAAALSPALLVFLVTYQAALRRVFEGGPFPSSTDAMGHLYRVFYVAQEWKQWRLIPQWTPGWYMGTPLLEFYPPLTTFVMAPVAALGDPALSYRVFAFVAMSLAAVLTTVLFRNRLGTAGAITAGILYSLAPFVLRTVFSDGVLPLALFIVIQPVLVRLLLDVFERPTAKRFLLASLGSAAMVLTHHLQALMFFVCIGAGIALAAAVHRRGVDRPVLVVASVIIGLMLAGIWLLPAMAPLHLADTPNRGDVGLPLTHSRGLSVFSPGERESPGAGPYLGLALIGVGIAGAAMTRRRPLSIVMVGAAAVALFMTFGMKNPVISSLPPLQTFVFFERFLLIASLSLALLTGLFVQALASHMETRFRLPRAALFLTVAVLAVGLADARPSFALVRQTDHNAWVLSSTILDREAPPGRLADFTGRSEASYFPAIAGRDSAYGSSIEGTPHAQDIRLLSEAIGRGHVGFTNRQLRQWWVTGAYVLPDDSFVSPVLETAGFARAEATGGATPWIRRDDASVANLLSRNAVIVGRAHRHAGVVFPWASRTRAGDYAELTDDVLLDNDMVVLAEAPDPIPDAVQSRLTAFQQRGGVILALLGNNPGVWRADMQLKRQRFSPMMTVIDRSGGVLESPVEVNGFVAGGNPWEALM
ncbi:MAG: glycosyltransferase family 39 protein, partial [Chloroflexi bacterium]|nr:glycosyltransferase family 39 protein [Chloroflexota bacterium]